MSRVPVHLVTGFLGAGKTTLLLDQLRVRQDDERCAVLVNDFGQARIDATLLRGRAQVREIAGGCVCCTAPEDLVPALTELLEQAQPDRVFIEATGLARPADILDTLARSPLQDRLELAPVVLVLDPRALRGTPDPVVLAQIEASDVLVINRADTLTDADRDAVAAHTHDRFPPWLGVHHTASGHVEPAVFDLRRQGRVFRAVPSASPSTQGWSSASRTWAPDRIFDLATLRQVLEGSGTHRIKGLFRTDVGWRVLQRSGDQVTVRTTGLRSASAVDVILRGTPAAAEALVAQLHDCTWISTEPTGTIRLSDGQGWTADLNRWALRALPGQVDDVREHLPKRAGHGVWLREVLDLLHPEPSDHFVVVASDGLTTDPLPIDQVGDALLVHGLDQGPLPDNKGGPFRLLVPEGRSGCANVKSVCRIEMVRP